MDLSFQKKKRVKKSVHWFGDTKQTNILTSKVSVRIFSIVYIGSKIFQTKLKETLFLAISILQTGMG